MKTGYSRNYVVTALLAGYFCAIQPAHAQELGQCSQEVLSSPTENSVRVRLTGVNEWPVNPICTWSASGTRADGSGYTWNATLIGDGLVENPTYVNVAVIMRYTEESVVFDHLVLNLFLPYPSDGFSVPVNSDPAFQSPAEGEGGTWYGTTIGRVPVSLSFYGRVSLDNANNLQVDITFTGGALPPDAGELIARVEGSGLSRRQQRPLLATLEAAQASLADGNCETAINLLEAFQHKVLVQLGGTQAELADALVAAAQSIIDSACGD